MTGLPGGLRKRREPGTSLTRLGALVLAGGPLIVFLFALIEVVTLFHFPVILIDGVDYPYAYCSPCHERYRSASPAPMPGQRTEVTNLRATGDKPLFMFPPFVRWRGAA